MPRRRLYLSAVAQPGAQETGKPVRFTFGLDNFLYCGLSLADNATYTRFRDVVALTAAWHCRVPVTPAATHHVPLVLPVWGVVEGDHLHVDNHLNFALHADAGKVVAAAAYPVRDRFQFAQLGSVISLHGPVRWFSKGSYVPLLGSLGGSEARAAKGGQGREAGDGGGQRGCSPLLVAAWSAVSVLLVRMLRPAGVCVDMLTPC